MKAFVDRFRKGAYVGDFVYGANDGIITTFAVVAGATGAVLSPGIIVILGFANLVADGFSMGASNALAIRSEYELEKKARDLLTPFQHGLVTFSAFIIAGLMPLLPYLFHIPTAYQFFASSALAALAFFSVGAARTFITKGNALKAGIEVLVIGGIAAFVAYGIGWIIRTVFGVAI